MGDLAALLANALGLDGEYAAKLGYLHDIGRRIDPNDHICASYRFLTEQCCADDTYICLTHSFLNGDLSCICACPLSEQSVGCAAVKAFAEAHANTDCDRSVQLCGLLCLPDGGTSLEARTDDIEARRGTHAGSAQHRAAEQAQDLYRGKTGTSRLRLLRGACSAGYLKRDGAAATERRLLIRLRDNHFL